MQRCNRCGQPAAQAPAIPTGTNVSRLCRRCTRRSMFGFSIATLEPIHPPRKHLVLPAHVVK